MKFVIDKSALTSGASIPLAGGLLTLNVQHSDPPPTSSHSSGTGNRTTSLISTAVDSSSSSNRIPSSSNHHHHQCNDCNHQHQKHYSKDTQPLLPEDNSKSR